MKLDEVTKEIVIEIQNTLKKEGTVISMEEIVDVVESQFITANLAFKKGLDIRLPLFGTFVRKHGQELGESAQELNRMKDSISKEAFERKTLENKMINKEKRKQRKKEMVRVTFDVLKETKDKVGVKNKLDKLL